MGKLSHPYPFISRMFFSTSSGTQSWQNAWVKKPATARATVSQTQKAVYESIARVRSPSTTRRPATVSGTVLLIAFSNDSDYSELYILSRDSDSLFRAGCPDRLIEAFAPYSYGSVFALAHLCAASRLEHALAQSQLSIRIRTHQRMPGHA